MDVGLGAVRAPLIVVPSQSRPGASHHLNIGAGACSRCGRATAPENIWNICHSCAAGGSLPSAPIAVAPESSTVHLHSRPTAECTACHITLSVPSQYRTAHVLCPPCQARHTATVKPSPQHNAVPQSNPYPVVTPTVAGTMHTLGLTLAFTYPGVPAPPLTSAFPASVSTDGGRRVHVSANRGQDALRVCMRFGCGSRLPAHVLGNLCSACAGAGFARSRPAVVQKRMPRRETERTCVRPRESLELVRASLLLEDVHAAKATAKGKHVEDECEVDLVYPDGFPVATPRASTNSESILIEDEDAELELVYPEDVAKAACTSSSKPRTKSSPPSSLRELFKDGLRTIPAIPYPTIPADKAPPRHCVTLGCTEVLSAETCIQRCVNCSVGDWKRRKLDAMDPCRRPSTSSLTTNTSMEEKEVATMLDDMDTSDVEDGSDLPPPSSSPNKGSSSEQTDDHGIRPIPGWDSDLTELSDSDVESVSDSGSEPDPVLARPQGDTTGLRIRIPLLVTRLPPDTPVRKCGNKRCNVAVPMDHRWKTCDPCRSAQRTYQRMRFEKKRRSMLGLEELKSPNLSCQRWRSLSPDVHNTDRILTPETSRPCAVRHCRTRIPLPEVYQWKTCVGCRNRARHEARWKRDGLVATEDGACRPEVVPRFPAYQNRGALLASLDAQLRGFVEGQLVYLRAKLHDDGGRSGRGQGEAGRPDHAPMLFVFAGEYSTVTGQRDSDSEGHSGRWRPPDSDPSAADVDAMRQEVSRVVVDLEHVLHARFRAGEAFAIDGGGILVRFTCALELIAHLCPLVASVGSGPGSSGAPDVETSASKDKDEDGDASLSMTPTPPPNNPPAVPLVKALSGELEAVVVPDDSHRLFHGQRTVIRFRMVG